MDYISVKETSTKWGVTSRWVHILCKENRIEGAKRVGNIWIIPADAQRPTDARYKVNRKKSDTE